MGGSFKYEKFPYKMYEESQGVKEAKTALDAHSAAKPAAYQSKWQAQIDETLDKILNREKFHYDVNGDALYHQYVDQFTREGKAAAEDMMGKAAAMTGGYGNSYAATAGQQTYNASLAGIGDVIPDLYAAALDRYTREGDALGEQYAYLQNEEDKDYAKYREILSDYLTEHDRLTDRYDAERDFDYGKYVDARDFEYGKHADEQEYYLNQFTKDNGTDSPAMLTDVEDIATWRSTVLSADTEEEMQQYCERLSKIDPTLAQILSEEWAKENGIEVETQDTSVKPIKKVSSGGGGSSKNFLKKAFQG